MSGSILTDLHWCIHLLHIDHDWHRLTRLPLWMLNKTLKPVILQIFSHKCCTRPSQQSNLTQMGRILDWEVKVPFVIWELSLRMPWRCKFMFDIITAAREASLKLNNIAASVVWAISLFLGKPKFGSSRQQHGVIDELFSSQSENQFILERNN